MGAPFEVVLSGNWDMYLAPLGTAFPDFSAETYTPAATWKRVARRDRVTPDGIVYNRSEEILDINASGASAPIKQVRTSESHVFTLNCYDFTLETLTYLFNQNTITETAKAASKIGYKSMKLDLDQGLTTFAALLYSTDASPYGTGRGTQDWRSVFEIQQVSISGDLEITFNGETPVQLQFVLTALQPSTGDIVTKRDQSDVVGP